VTLFQERPETPQHGVVRGVPGEAHDSQADRDERGVLGAVVFEGGAVAVTAPAEQWP
jgi:hypothetical protein